MRISRTLAAAALAAAVAGPLPAGATYEAVAPPPPACTQSFGSGARPTLVVADGQVVCLTGTTVNGSILVNAGGALLAQDILVTGNITAVEATYLKLCGSTVRGSVTNQRPDGFVHIGDVGETQPACAPNTVRNSVSVLSGVGGYIVSGNTVNGNVTVNDNVGLQIPQVPYEIGGNTIGGSLTCLRNRPLPEDNGYPNIVTGTINCQLAGDID